MLSKRLCFVNVMHDARKSEFSIFLGIILSAFKRSNTKMHVFYIVIPFLNSSEMVLFIA